MKPLFALLCSWSIPQHLLLPQILDLLLINISITCETERMINELEIGPNEITCDPILYWSNSREEWIYSFPEIPSMVKEGANNFQSAFPYFLLAQWFNNNQSVTQNGLTFSSACILYCQSFYDTHLWFVRSFLHSANYIIIRCFCFVDGGGEMNYNIFVSSPVQGKFACYLLFEKKK